MKNFVLVPDSFKGTMSSTEICEIMSEEILKKVPDADITSIPVADGGEGTVDCFLQATKGEKYYETVKGPYFEDMQGFYAIINEGKTAIIEMAACASLPLVEDRKNPALTTTFGVGELINAAINKGCRDIVVGLGGSCTNDAACGCAAALGVKFLDEHNAEFIPTGGTLNNIKAIDTSGINPQIKNCDITVMCDIDNPLYGENGAAYVYAPQKGADDEMVKLLDANLKYLSDIIKEQLDIDVSDLAGGGAAGGMGAGIVAFLGGKLNQGINVVLDIVKFDDIIKTADLILTGEGKIDSQSIRGKVVIGVSKRAMKQNVPVIAVVGDIGDDVEKAYEMGVSSIISINRVAVPFEKARIRSKSDMHLTIENLMRILNIKR